MFQPSSAGVEAVAMDTRCVNGTVFGHTGNSAGAVGHKGMDHHGCPPQQISPLMADTFAAVMHSHLGGSSPLDDSGAPNYWTANLSQQDPSAAFMVPAQPYLSRNATLLQQQQYQAHLASASAAAAAAAADPNAALYANYRAQHPQAFAEADRLSYGSDVSTAAIAAAAQHQQGMLAAEMAFKARQLAQLQQQQHALQQQPQQQLLLAQQAQQQQQHRSAVGAAAVPAATSALYRASSSHSSMTHHQQHPSISYSTLPQSSHYPASMQAPSTAAARLPPRPNTAHVQQYHPYHSTATGATTLEHHHHNSLAAAAAAARAAAIQQQQQCSSAPSATRQAASAAAAAAGAAAALQHGGNAGRWSGAVAVLDQRILGAAAGTQASGNDQHCSLECDEELLSMDGLDQDDPQQQHPQHSTEVTSGSFGSKGRNISSGPAAAQLQGGSAGRPHHLLSSGLATSSAQHAAAASAAARAAAAGYAFNHLEEDDAVFDMYEDSGSTHPDSDGSSDDMDADTEPMQDQHQRRNSTSDRTGAGGSSGGQRQPGSSSGRAPAAAAAPASAQQANAAKLDAQAVSLHVLSSVANRRKGEQVLTAHPAVAEAAGARSVRTRLLITEVSLYCENAATSMLALQQSNKLLSKMSLPDDIAYMPVSSDSFLFKAAHAWQFPAFVICLGSSYMQRMLAKLPQLAQTACACPGFEDYCRYMHNTPAQLPPRVTGEEAQATAATLRSVLFTCLFLATKMADQVHALGLLRFILTNLSHNGMMVTLQQAIDIEARCLDALDWRLGPFFTEDDLTDDDVELWSSAMGHWDYGSAADLGY